METWDVVVVGAGVAGMTAAALLAHDGRRVLLLEGHDKPGGCAGYYRKAGFTFDVGATVLTGLGEGDLHHWVFRHLGVSMAAESLPGLHVHLPDRGIRVAHDHGLWVHERRTAFPEFVNAAERFWRGQERISDILWRTMGRQPSLPLRGWNDAWRTLRTFSPAQALLLPRLNSAMAAALRGTPMERDAAFRAFLDLLLLITVQETSENAAYLNGCVGLDIYRHGVFRAKGGMKALSDTLLRAFERDGGCLRTKQRVSRIQCINGLWEITTRKGETVRARCAVANLPVWNLSELVSGSGPPSPTAWERGPGGEGNPQLTPLLERAGEGWGAGVLYLGVAESAIPDGAWQHHQVLQEYGASQEDGNAVFLSLSAPGDTESAPPGFRTLNVSTHTRVGGWFGLEHAAYEAKKEALAERMTAGVRRLFPNVDEGLAYSSAATPKTWEVFTQRKQGQVGGLRGTPGRVNLNALPRRMGWPDLWVVGDTTFPGQGTVAATLSGVNAWKDIRAAG